MTAKIKAAHFTGGAQIYAKNEGGLTHAIRSLLQAQAKIAASAVTALTDNGGGTADGDIEAIGSFTLAALGSTDCAQKAELEASFANVTDAFKEVIAQANLIHAKVPALDGTLVDSITGTAADGTVGAIDVSMTAVATSLASAVGANLVLDGIKNRLSQLTYHVNKLAVACGEAAIVDNGGGTASYSLTVADVSEGTGTAVSGSDATAANAGIKKTDCDAILVKVANAVKELTAKLNACCSATGGVLGAVAAA